MFGFLNVSRGFQIDPRLRQFAEKGVGLLLLLTRLIAEGRSICHAELRRPCLQCAIRDIS
jgi:hypothetical protein